MHHTLLNKCVKIDVCVKTMQWLLSVLSTLFTLYLRMSRLCQRQVVASDISDANTTSVHVRDVYWNVWEILLNCFQILRSSSPCVFFFRFLRFVEQNNYSIRYYSRYHFIHLLNRVVPKALIYTSRFVLCLIRVLRSAVLSLSIYSSLQVSSCQLEL